MDLIKIEIIIKSSSRRDRGKIKDPICKALGDHGDYRSLLDLLRCTVLSRIEAGGWFEGESFERCEVQLNLAYFSIMGFTTLMAPDEIRKFLL